MVDLNTPPAETVEDEFASAFDDLSALGDATKAPAKPAETPAAPAGETPPAMTPEEIAAEAAAGNEDETHFEGTPEEIAAQEAEAARVAAEAEPPKPTPSDLALERLAAALEANKPAPPQQRQTEQEPAVLTNDEIEVVSNYMKEFPEQARAESLRRKAEYNALVTHIYGEVSKVLTPLQEELAELRAERHLAQLQQAQPEYPKLRDPVIKWVDSQPAFLQDAYKRVIEEGTVDEINTLIERYKAETGMTAQRPAPKPDTELPPAAKKAAAALAPVSSKRTAAAQAPSPDDFDGAFLEASAALDKA